MKLPTSKVVFDHEEISRTIDEMAVAINERCRDGDWIAMCVLNGGLMFTSELMKRVGVAMRLDSIRVSRYHNTKDGKDLLWHAYPELVITDQSILLMDDIFDEGQTLAALSQYFDAAGARQVVSAVLVDKQHDRKVSGFKPDFVGLTCEDAYVFGFGMDVGGYFRNLPDIRRLVDR
ncbi:MAG: hypoxanthine-guanine phosphoribosyltransferase [Pseudomonadales bacterium]